MAVKDPLTDDFTRQDYPGIFRDYDSDNIPNVDDPHPLTAGDTETIEEVSLAEEVQKLIDIRTEYEAVLDQVMGRLRQMKPSATVMGRVKSPFSVINKLRRKRLKAEFMRAEAGEKYTQGLTDMAGCMIILENQQQVDEVVSKIKDGNAGDVFEHENFYQDPLGGYRAHHFIVVLNGLPVEIQVKTQRMKLVAEASHTPYKQGVLNAEYMEELTDLAWQADQGDNEAQELFAEEMAQGDLQEMLTLRDNPAEDEEVAQLREDFRDSVRKLALIFALDKFPSRHKEKGLRLFREHGEIIGVDFDAVFQSALEEAETKPKVTKALLDEDVETGGDSDPSTVKQIALGKEDLDLNQFPPIEMTTGQRAEANDRALAVLQKEDRAISADDIEILRKYTGNGGLKDKAYVGEELEGKKRGTLNEHYTSYPVIKMIWDKLVGMGLEHGNILEPGAGIGNFAGFLPNRETMRMIMVEQSVVSSRIASLLYPNQLVLNQKMQNVDLGPYNITGVVGNVPFGDYRIASRHDPLKNLNPPIHDYFILKSLDGLEPGGFLAVITSTGTMDKKNPKLRQAMTQRAKFVGAYRLPSTAFKSNADTLVTTDLLIFQKYQGQTDATSDPLNRLFAFEDLSVASGEFGSNNETYQAYYNAYWDEHPEMILGEHLQGHNVQWPTRMGVKGTIDGETISRVLNDDLSFPYALPGEMSFYDVPDNGVMLDVDRDYHPGNIVHHEGTFYEKQRRFYKEIKIGSNDKAGQGLRQRIGSACDLLDTYDDFVTALAQDTDQKEPLRGDFKRKLDDHIDTYGVPNEDDQIRKVFKYDNRLYKLTTFAKTNPTTGELVYADIIDAESMFSDNYTPSLDDSADLTEVALFGNAIGETLDEDFYLSTWKGGTATAKELEEALKAHKDFFYNPETERYEFRYEYLAGDVRGKLEIAESYDLQKNVEALKKVLPEWIDVYKIQADPRHIFTYLPPKVLEQFIKDKFNYREVQIGLVKDKAEIGNKFQMRLRRGKYVSFGDSKADRQLGWGTVPFTKILNRYIQDKTFPWVTVNEEGEVLGIGKTKLKEKFKAEKSKGIEGRYTSIWKASKQKQSTNNQEMLTRIPREFNSWLRSEADTEMREAVEQAYNKAFNSHVNPQFDGSTLRFRGMSDTFYGVKDFRVYKHNRAVAEKMVWNGRGANCHDVGAGKTLASILTSQVLLQQGAANKCMFVVPSKVQEKWVEEYSQLFPDAKILNMKMKKANRHKELTMAQLYDWDAIFMADHSFKQLQLSPDQQAKQFAERVRYFDEMLENFDEKVVEEDEGLKNSSKRRIVKNLEKQKEEFEAKLEDVSHAKRLETDIFFDELGVDCLFFDEAHFYKNAISSPKAQKLGIAATKTSQRAEDALQKTRWLFDKVGYKNVFVLTATPVVNSPIEVWHLLNLCAPDLLEKYEIHNLDNFINLYVRTEEKLIKKTTGKYSREMVVGGYINLPEMRDIIDEVMDIKSYDQLITFYKDNPEYYIGEDGKRQKLEPQFKRPDANVQQQIVEPSPIHQLLFDDIVLRAQNVLQCMKSKKKCIDNFLVITGDGSKIATDLRVYDSDFEGVDQKYLKLGDLVDNVTETYQQRTNPSPGIVPDDIYGNFFTRHVNRMERSNPVTGRNRQALIDELKEMGYFSELVDEIMEGEALDGQPPSVNWMKKQIEKKRDLISDGSDKQEEKFDRALHIVEQLYRSNPQRQTYRNQIIFCDWISLEDGRPGSFHELIKDKLVETGIPKKEITIINGGIIGTNPDGSNYTVGSTDNKEELKKQVQDDFNQGKYRVLIGNKSIAEGMNLQKWTTDIHHMDVPYTPSEIQQRNGRGLRQGNQWDEVGIHFYLMQDSFDQYRLELVNKKQSWIDELFFGDSRQTDTQSEAESMNYEEMVAATNSDPRIKEFFEAKATARELQGKVQTLSQEVQRLQSSIAKSEEDIQRKRDKFNKTVERERALMEADLPDTPQEVLDEDRLQVKWNEWNDYKDIRQIDVDISSDHRRFFASRINIELEVPQGNPNGRVKFDLSPPDSQERKYYGRNRWNLIKRMAPKALEKAFGWTLDKSTQTGMSIAGNLGNVLADQGDFYDYYDVDIEAERERDEDLSYGEIKRTHGMHKMQRWVPIVELKLAQLFLILERRWVGSAQHRISLIEENLEQSEKTFRELEANLAQTQEDLEESRETRQQALKTQNELADVVNEIATVEYPSRSELYQELNRIAPDYGIENVIHIRDVAADMEDDDDTRENPALRTNPVGPLVYIGRTERIHIDGGGTMKALEGDFPTFVSKDRLYIVPEHRVEKVMNAVEDQETIEGFEEWHHYDADEVDLEIDWPEGKAQPVGTAHKIWYASDKIIQEGDRKGKINRYVHGFDSGKRPAVVKGDILVVGNIDWNGRGLLN